MTRIFRPAIVVESRGAQRIDLDDSDRRRIEETPAVAVWLADVSLLGWLRRHGHVWEER